MDAVCGVAVRVEQVDRARVLEVAQRGLGVADRGGDHALDAGRERGVAGGQRVVVVERPPRLLLAEVVLHEVGGEHDVGLLDHLVAVELERVVVQQQRVLLRRRPREVPAFAIEEVLVLQDDAELLVARDVHVLGGTPPARRSRRRSARLSA